MADSAKVWSPGKKRELVRERHRDQNIPVRVQSLAAAHRPELPNELRLQAATNPCLLSTLANRSIAFHLLTFDRLCQARMDQAVDLSNVQNTASISVSVVPRICGYVKTKPALIQALWHCFSNSRNALNNSSE